MRRHAWGVGQEGRIQPIFPVDSHSRPVAFTTSKQKKADQMLHRIPSDVLDVILEQILDVLYPECFLNLSEVSRYLQRTLAPHIKRMRTLLQNFESLRNALLFSDLFCSVDTQESLPYLMRSLMAWHYPIPMIRLCVSHKNPFLSTDDFVDQFLNLICCRAKPANISVVFDWPYNHKPILDARRFTDNISKLLQNVHIHTLSIYQAPIYMSLLGPTLAHNSCVTQVKLSNVGLDASACAQLAVCLPQNLTILDVSMNRISHALHFLVNAILKSKVVVFDVSFCQLKLEDKRCLTTLSDRPHIQVLDFGNEL